MSVLLVIGVAFSVVLSTTLALTGTDTPASIIIGLAIIIISLLLDLMNRASRMESRLIDASQLSNDMVKDEGLFSAIAAIARDYHNVLDKVDYAIFRDRAKSALSECQDALHNLCRGPHECSSAERVQLRSEGDTRNTPGNPGHQLCRC